MKNDHLANLLRKLKNSIHTAIRMLDNVIDLNFYPTKESKKSNLQHRPIGLGIMGIHDVLHIKGINIDSNEAVEWNNYFFEFYTGFHHTMNLEHM